MRLAAVGGALRVYFSARRAASDPERHLQSGQSTGYVFVWENGRPFHPEYVTAVFRKAVKRSGVKPIRLHDLRRTNATLAFQSGVHPKVVAERLGHSNIQLTLSIYSRVIPTLESEAAKKLASLILE